MQASKGTPGPKLEACTPRRPGYAADLRDASLVAAGATAKLVRQPVTFTMGQVRRGFGGSGMLLAWLCGGHVGTAGPVTS